jgi:hypothetical protein
MTSVVPGDEYGDRSRIGKKHFILFTTGRISLPKLHSVNRNLPATTSTQPREKCDRTAIVGLLQVVGRVPQAFDEVFKLQFSLFLVIAKLLPSRYNVDTVYIRFCKSVNYSELTNLKVRFNLWWRQLQSGEIV